LRYYCHIAEHPADLMNTINTVLHERSHQGMFVTLIYMVLNTKTGELTITNAGHLPPLWYQLKNNRYEIVDDIAGIPLGIMLNEEFSNRVVQLSPGDMILLYTDGIIEAKNKQKEMFSLARLEKIVADPGASPQELIEKIVDNVKNFTKRMRQHDDITLLALKWRQISVIGNS